MKDNLSACDVTERLISVLLTCTFSQNLVEILEKLLVQNVNQLSDALQATELEINSISELSLHLV